MKAWLIVNEFLQTGKFNEIHDWLINAANQYGIDMRILTNAQILTILGENQTAKDDVDFVLFWDKDVRLARYLEVSGLFVLNSSNAIAVCDDKSLTHLYLQTNHIPMPKTIIAPMTYENIGYRNYGFLDLVEKEIAYPMIIKECFGSFGMQVYCVNDRDEVLKCMKKIGAKPFLFQEFIESSAGKDIRIHVVGGKVITSMYRYSMNGDFRANITNGGHMKPYEPTELEKKMAIECCEILGLDFAGIDLLFGPENQPLVCEVNSNAHFKNIFDCTGVNVAEEIIKYAKAECNKRKGGSLC